MRYHNYIPPAAIMVVQKCRFVAESFSWVSRLVGVFAKINIAMSKFPACLISLKCNEFRRSMILDSLLLQNIPTGTCVRSLVRDGNEIDQRDVTSILINFV